MEYQSTIRIESKTCPGVAFSLHKPSYGRTLDFDRKNAAFREEARKINKQSRDLQEELETYRKAWFEGQAKKLADLKEDVAIESTAAADAGTRASAIARIETGLDYERMLELAQRAMTDEQSQEVAEKLMALPADKEVFQMDPELLELFRSLREKSDQLVAMDYNPARLKWGLASIEGLTINGKAANADSLFQDGPPDLVREIVGKIDEITSMTPEQLRNFERPSSSDAAERTGESTITAIAA